MSQSLPELSRRSLLMTSALSCGGLARVSLADPSPSRGFAFGFVTYMWGADWSLPQLIKNCTLAKVLGVELRTTHAHKVERTLTRAQRNDVRKRFADSPVTLVGIGSNERFDNPDPTELKKAIDATKAFIELSHDVGGTGVKVKPDRFHKSVPREKTIEQIGTTLNQLGEFAEGYGQQVRLEVHGQCAEIPVISQIMKIATHTNVAVCWNSNSKDLADPGLEANFQALRPRFGQTLHIRELDYPDYPISQLLALLIASEYRGWAMLEGTAFPKESASRVEALAKQQQLFTQLALKAAK